VRYDGFAAPPQPDKIFVHIDKSYYVSGETINYKVYFLNRESIESKIVHVELVGANDSIYQDQINLITGNAASGKFNLPISFKEGNYLFRCYTAWNINFGSESIFYKVIPVYNEWLSGNPVDQNIDYYKKDSLGFIGKGNAQISIELKNDGPVHPGDSVSIELFIEGSASAEVSLTAFDLNLVRPVVLDDYTEYLNELNTENEIEIKYDPEKSISVQGTVREQITNEPVTSSVLSVFNVQEANFTRIKSKDGSFSFELPLFEGSAQFQIINMNPYQEKVPVVQTQSLISYIKNQPEFSEVAVRTEEVKKYLYFSKLRRHIDEVFYQDRKDSLQLVTTQYLQFDPDKTYDMENYRYIKNFEDFIRQAVPNATSFKEKDSRMIKLYNSETKKYFMTKPWLLVDNYFVFNDSIVYNMPFNQIKRIEIFNTNQSIFKYFEPIMIQGGVIAVYTKNNFLFKYVEATPNMLLINGLPLNNPVYKLQHSSGAPDMEPIIHWEPNISIESNRPASFSFQTNDITGQCMIQVVGMDSEGNLIEGNMVYEVSDKID
jgi:hypothetical protein